MSTNSKNNQIILKEMKKIYYSKDKEYKDWMGYQITEDNKPSYHHIMKQEELKKKKISVNATVENGAYLGKHSHEKLHHIELMDKELYECWNYLFLVINKMKIYPIPDVWKMIEDMQSSTENTLQEDPKVLKKKKREIGNNKN